MSPLLRIVQSVFPPAIRRGDTWSPKAARALDVVIEAVGADLVMFALAEPHASAPQSRFGLKSLPPEVFRQRYQIKTRGSAQIPPRRSPTPVGAPTPPPAGAERDSGADRQASPAPEDLVPYLGRDFAARLAKPAGAERDIDAQRRGKPATPAGAERAADSDHVDDARASRDGLNERAFGAETVAAADVGGIADQSELERAAREGDKERASGAQDHAAEALVTAEYRNAEISFIDPAFGYDRGPLGSRDWALYARGWLDRAGINKEVSNELMRKRHCQFAYTEIRIGIGAEQVAVYGSEEGFRRPGAAAEMARLAGALVEQMTSVKADAGRSRP